MRSRSCLCAVIGLASFVSACGGGGESVAPPPTPAAIVAVGGNQQTGPAGGTLVQPLGVRVTSASGTGIEGVAVAFVTAANSGSVSASSVTTNADGFASTTWKLGTTAGADIDTVRASVSVLGAGVVFTATVTAGPAASLTSLSGDSQTGPPGQRLPQSLVVVARDQYGNPRSHVDVVWSVASGGGSISHTRSTTGVDGITSVGWTLGSAGPNTAQATVAGLAGSPVSFVASLSVVPSQLSTVSGNNQTAAPGQLLAQPLVVALRTQAGVAVGGVDVIWAVTSGGGTLSHTTTITGPDGRSSVLWTLGPTDGAQGVAARVEGSMGSPVSFAATASASGAATVEKVSGDHQTGRPGEELANPLVLRVRDAAGRPVPGLAVTWVIGSGNGSLEPDNVTTDSQGHASSRLTLGTAGPTTIVATVIGGAITGSPITFTATAVATTTLDIELRFLVTPTTLQRQAFAAAEARWEGIIAGDLADLPLSKAAGSCGDNSPAINEWVDDLLILVSFEEMDGPDGTLAAAGPCSIRTANGLPILGVMQFDVTDIASVEAAGALSDVILHEMGHVLGIGTLWEYHRLLSGASLSGGTDPYFTGLGAIAAFNDVGGATYVGGQKVPVENIGGAGTADGHWRESVMGDELMTGFVSLSEPMPNPLSVITIQSLADQGYSINAARADPYTLLSALRADRRGASLALGDDRLRISIEVVDATGRVTRVVQP